MTLALTASSRSTLWYLSRGSGVVTLLLLTAATVLGVLTARNWQSPHLPRFVTSTLHRNISVLAVVFLGVHVSSVVIDGFAPIGWLSGIVPFISPYRPVWLGLGAIAADLLLAVLISSAVRRRLGYRGWQAVHLSSYACWPIAVLHGLGSGTDVAEPWLMAITAACVAAVLGAVLWRLAAALADRPALRATLTAVSVVTPVALGIMFLVGPDRPGWARRAGTPAATINAAAGQVTHNPAPARGLDGELSGTLSDDGVGNVTVRGSVTDSSSGTQTGTLEVDLHGQPSNEGGIVLDAGTITVTSSTGTLTGPVTGLDGDTIIGNLSGAAGATSRARIVLQRTSDAAITGRIKISPEA